MRTSLMTMCNKMCGMCCMPMIHICLISECDVFKLEEKI